MGFRLDGIGGGGGQFKPAIEKIMEAERLPVKALQSKKAKEESKSRLFAEFKSKFLSLDKAITEVGTFRRFRELKVDYGDGAQLVEVTLDKERAEPGQYSLSVNSLAKKASMMTEGIDSPDRLLGAGRVSIRLNDGNFLEYNIDENESTLRNIVGKINRTKDTPMVASVMQDVSEGEEAWKIIFSAKKDGTNGAIQSVHCYFEADSLSIDSEQEAENAIVTINDFEVELPSNTITDFFPGTNLHLKQARPNQPFVLTISEDYQKMSGKLKGVVEGINEVLNFIGKQNAIDDRTDTSVTFAGDSSLQSIEYQVRNLIHSTYNVADEDADEEWMTLSDLGVEFDKSARLLFKEDKFQKSLEKDFEKISRAVSGPGSFIDSLSRFVGGTLRSSDGFIHIKEKVMQSRIRAFDEQIDNKSRMMEKKQRDLIDKFARLEATLSNLQRQQQYISSALGGGGVLPGLS